MEHAMNLADPDLELVDPTPNVHSLFIQFDKIFFYTKLASRAVVRWSKRMYSCAGVCSYEGRCGLCDIALSEPLLKLRPRKDLIQTLLHEMIHAFLFVTNQDQDRGGHGPNFKAHMHRINNAAGLNISIYHDFHDEVELYQIHWWRCDGPCQTWKPHFGIVRKSANRAPGPKDSWFSDHKRKCGGTFVKIKEPENQKSGNKPAVKKSNTENITKYITYNIKTIDDKQMPRKPLNSITKTSNNVPSLKVKSNNTNTVVVPQKGVSSSPQINKTKTPILFTGKGNTISDNSRLRTNSAGVLETVRSVWASKQIGQINTSTKRTSNVKTSKSTILNTTKHKAETTDSNSPPKKIMKIDDYFKTKASSILKDIYGEDFKVTQSETSNKLIAVKSNNELVDCPVCSSKIVSSEVNRHLDECLNKDILKNLSSLKDSEDSNFQPSEEHYTIRDGLNTSPLNSKNNDMKNETMQSDFNRNKDFIDSINIKTEPSTDNKMARKSDNFIIPNVSAGRKSPILVVKKEKSSTIKIEPGTSKDQINLEQQICPCCGTKITKPIEEHLDECLAFFDNNTTMPEERASTSFTNETIVIDDDDDIFDETQTFNATGTKSPCPCCLNMIEMREMNAHLDECLN